MKRLRWVNPEGLRRRTGGTLYNEHIVDGLRSLGWRVDVVEAGGGELPSQGLTVVDGLVFPELQVRGGPLVALIHSPLHRERGRAWLEREQRALARAHHVVATSRLSLEDLGVGGRVFEPGCDPGPRSTGTGVLSIGHLVPRKGHRMLLDALDLLEQPPRVRCVGSLQADPEHARSLLADARVDWLGELSDLEPEYARAGLLVHCARFEAWGMVLDEALARGLAVVTTPAGALERCREQVRVVHDAEGLAAALREWRQDPEPLRRRARGARIPPWSRVVADWDQWLSELASRG